ncbi:MAG: LemA family protein [Magnetococcales bacterium]|nr:LemA family protein [Magnetococcales bacterium]
MSDKKDPMDEMDDIGLELTSSERMQRMRKLMRQLYQEEEATHATTLPPIKSKSLILVSSISAIVFLIVTTFYNFNRFVAAEEQVLSSRGHIHDALQRRSNLFGNLVNLTLNHAMLEQEVFRYVSDGRLGMMGQTTSGGNNGQQGSSGQPAQSHASAPPQKLSASQPFPSPAVPTPTPSSPMEALSRLFGLVEQYPDIKTSTTYQQLMDKLVDIENMISQRRDEYNTEVKLYNTLITSFPWSIMSRILGFERYQYFTAGTGPDNMNMDLDSRKFMRLIPEVELTNTHHKEVNKPETGTGTPLPNAPGAAAPETGTAAPTPAVPPGKVQPESDKVQPGTGEKTGDKAAPAPSQPENGRLPPGQPLPAEPKPEKAVSPAESNPPAMPAPDMGTDASQTRKADPVEPDAKKSMRLISENKLVSPPAKETPPSDDAAVHPEPPKPSTDTLGNVDHESPNPKGKAPASAAAKPETGGKAPPVNAQKGTDKPMGASPAQPAKATEGTGKPAAKTDNGTKSSKAAKAAGGTTAPTDKVSIASAKPVVTKTAEPSDLATP